MATAFGVRALGTALVFHFNTLAMMERRPTGFPFPKVCGTEDDYQSGPERPRSKGSADLIYAGASNKLSGVTAGARLILRQRLLLQPELRSFGVRRPRALFRQPLEIIFGLFQIAEPMPARAEGRQQFAARMR